MFVLIGSNHRYSLPLFSVSVQRIMSTLQEKFDKAATEVRSLPQRPTDDELLLLYGLYKQATVGDNNTSQPWMFQMEARAKWDAWTKQKGKSKEKAQEEYIQLVEQLKQKYQK